MRELLTSPKKLGADEYKKLQKILADLKEALDGIHDPNIEETKTLFNEGFKVFQEENKEHAEQPQNKNPDHDLKSATYTIHMDGKELEKDNPLIKEVWKVLQDYHAKEATTYDHSGQTLHPMILEVHRNKGKADGGLFKTFEVSENKVTITNHSPKTAEMLVIMRRSF